MKILIIRIVLLLIFLDFMHSYIWGQKVVPMGKPIVRPAGVKYNFHNYNIEEGLPQTQIRKIIQDHNGNIWIGTFGGGVSKFDGKTFVTYSDKDGLANNVVRSILEDQQGNIWFATNGGGVSKFNGQYFINFTTKEGLASNFVWSILQDHKGQIWCGATGGGVSIYKEGGSFTVMGKERGLPFITVISMYEDKKNNIWLGTFGAGLYKFDGEKFIDFTKDTYLKDKKIYSIIEDRNGTIWIANNKGLSKYDATQPGKFLDLTENEEFGSKPISSIMEDKKGNLWMGSFGNGIIKYDGKSFSRFTEKVGLKGDLIETLLEDREGNLWFGTDGEGITKLIEQGFLHYGENEGLTNISVKSILEDHNKTMWLGTQGVGLFKYNGKTFEKYTTKEGLSGNNIRSIIEDRDQNIWFGTEDGGICKYDWNKISQFTETQGLLKNFIFTLAEDLHGNIWAATNGGGLAKYDPGKTGEKPFVHFTTKEGLNNDDVRTVFSDHKGKIWVGTGFGVSSFDPENSAIPGNFFTPITQKEWEKNMAVWSIAEDSKHNLWFGSYGGGICKYDGVRFTYFTTSEGLINNSIASLVIDKKDNIWVGTIAGISKVFPLPGNSQSRLDSTLGFYTKYAGYGIRNYGRLEGVSAIECNKGASSVDSQGNIWLGTTRELIRFSPEEDKINMLEPLTHLTNLKIFYEKFEIKIKDSLFKKDITYDGLPGFYPLPTNLVLPYDKNFITFEFIGISMKIPEKVRYQWKLEGFNDQWSPESAKNEATYSFLAPGKYRFLVKACNDEGIWNKVPISYSFEITPPWWQTLAFRVMSVCLIILGIWFFIRWRLSTFRKEKEILEAKVEIEHKLLRLQMNPHFIYNSLNAIQNFIFQNRVKESAMYISNFASLMRLVLENSRLDHITIERELNTLKLYLDLQQLRFANKFDYTLDIDPDIDPEEINIPPMFAQPFIENAIEHGFLNKKGKGQIDIRLKLKGEFITFEIQDNGIGRKKSEELRQTQDNIVPHKSLATEITRERITMLNLKSAGKIKFNISDLMDENNHSTGTKVTFDIPYIII